MNKVNFYRAFEDRHRGSRETIKLRLNVYLPFIQALKNVDAKLNGIDLGCGRGEWLEYMQENGVDLRGVDLDLDMLQSASEAGLDVIHGDAIAELKSQVSSSLSMVTGFHLAEHLPFEVLQVLINESLRVIKPGGLLILETPNPENIVVGTSNFYLDPTHQRPIPIELLSFMVEYAGFDRVKVLRLQEPLNITTSNPVSLHSVLSGVSPDYAVVAQKGGSSEGYSALTPMFNKDYGCSLEFIASRFDHQMQTRLQEFESVLNRIQRSYSWRLGSLLRRLLARARFK